MTAIKHRQVYGWWYGWALYGNNENIIAIALDGIKYKAHILSCIVIIFCVFVGYDSQYGACIC